MNYTNETNQEKIALAASMAAQWHMGQFRKKTATPYIVHPERVANKIELLYRQDVALRCAAWLHDVVEDTEATIEEVEEVFGSKVAQYVMEMTEPEEPMGGYESHKAKHLDKDAYMRTFQFKSLESCLLKLCDRIDNLNDWEGMNPGSRRGYALSALHLHAAVLKNKKLKKCRNHALLDALRHALTELTETIMKCTATVK